MTTDAPIRMRAKIEKASAKVGSVSKGLPGIPAGTLYYRAYQKSAGSQKHSSPCGRRHTRFYQGAHKSLNVKKSAR